MYYKGYLEIYKNISEFIPLGTYLSINSNLNTSLSLGTSLIIGFSYITKDFQSTIKGLKS